VRVTTKIAFALAAAALVLVPRVARGGGMETGDNGGEAMGRGGAFVAKADNPAAVNYNPAGFAKLRGWHLAVSANAFYSQLDFQRTGDRLASSTGGDGSFPMVSNSKPWFVVPMHMMLTTDFGYFDRLTFAAGFYGPSVASHEFGSTVGGQAAPQRFDMLSMGGLIMFPTVGIAYHVHEMLDIGVTFQAVVTSVQTKTIATVSAACAQAEDPGCDVNLDVNAQSYFAPTGSVGLLFRPTRSIELGSLVRFPSSSTLEGKAKVSFGDKVKDLESHFQYKMLEPAEPNVKLNNDYPWMFRLGARYVWWRGDEEKADIELDFIYEAWSKVSKRTVQIDATSLGAPLKAMEMDSKLADTFAVRAGGAYNFRLGRDWRMTARAGAFGETQTNKVSDTSLQNLAGPKFGVSAGLGLTWKNYRLDVAYAHVFVPDRKVQQSTVRANDFGGGGEGPVVGNGLYSGSVDGLYLQLSGSFGAGRLQERRRSRDDDFEPLARNQRKPAREVEEKPAASQPGSSAEFDPDAVVYEGEYERAAATSRPASAPAQTAPRTAMSFDGDEVPLARPATAMSFRGDTVKLGRGKAKQARAGRATSRLRAEGEKVVKHCPRRDRRGRCLRSASLPGGPTSLGMR
jgi:long-chain fatty acid transport protein